jgi:hypothetical protein
LLDIHSILDQVVIAGWKASYILQHSYTKSSINPGR